MNLSNGLLLDPRTGRPEGHPSHVEDREGLVWSWAHPDIDLEETLQGAPSHVLESSG
jgi:hypothetical protein